MNIIKFLKKIVGIDSFDKSLFHISPQFDFAYKFSQGLCPVTINKKGGYIDCDGNIAISPMFLHNGIFTEDGLAIAASGYGLNYKFGYINKSGDFIIPPIFDSVNNFKNGYARVVLDGVNINVDKNGNYISDGDLPLDVYHAFSEDLAKIHISDKNCYGFLNQSGGIQLILGNEIEEVNNFKNGLALAKVKGRYGYINKSGEFVINPKFGYAKDFNNGLAVVSKSKNGRRGFIDSSGQIVVPAKYYAASDFSDGWAEVRRGDKWGYINTRGDFVVDPYFEFTTEASEGYCAVQYNGRFGFIKQTDFM